MEPAWTDWRDTDSRRCSVARTAEVIGDGWAVLVLRDVFNGIRRFDELAEHLGVARNVLTRRLAALVEAGVLTREPYREPGARVRHEYRLTAAGRDLLPVILAMVAWGDRYRAGPRGRRCSSTRRLRRPGARGDPLRRGPPPPAPGGPAAFATRPGAPDRDPVRNGAARVQPSMGDYEHTTTVSAEADTLFRYLSDVNNLPDYFAAMKSAEPTDGDAVHTVAEVDGSEREGEAWFTAEEETRSIRWGAQGPNHYGGELEVTGAAGGSQVTVRLHTEHGNEEQIRRAGRDAGPDQAERRGRRRPRRAPFLPEPSPPPSTSLLSSLPSPFSCTRPRAGIQCPAHAPGTGRGPGAAGARAGPRPGRSGCRPGR